MWGGAVIVIESESNSQPVVRAHQPPAANEEPEGGEARAFPTTKTPVPQEGVENSGLVGLRVLRKKIQIPENAELRNCDFKKNTPTYAQLEWRKAPPN